jgi:hypothetical protein
MKKPMVVAIMVLGILLMSSFTVIANPVTAPGQLKEKKEKNPDAPGQWKKTQQYVNQSDFVFAVHWRIWERLQQKNVFPPGLMRLLGLLSNLADSNSDDEIENGEELPEDFEIPDYVEDPEDENPDLENPDSLDEPEEPEIPEE